MRIFTILTLGLLFVLGGQTADAQTNAVKQNIINQRNDLREFRAGTTEARQGFVTERKELKGEFKTTKEAFQVDAKVKRAEFAERLKNATTDEERAAIKAEAEQVRLELRNSVTTTREEFKERAKSVLSNRLEYILKKFDAFIERARDIGLRINEKLKDLDQSGINVDREIALYEQGKVLFNSAEESVAKARKIYTNIDTETMTRDEIKASLVEIKTILREARTDIKNGFQKLRDIIKSLRKNTLSTKTVEVNTSSAASAKPITNTGSTPSLTAE